jgi:DNA-binding CsgD family transcriptional regulator
MLSHGPVVEFLTWDTPLTKPDSEDLAVTALAAVAQGLEDLVAATRQCEEVLATIPEIGDSRDQRDDIAELTHIAGLVAELERAIADCRDGLPCIEELARHTDVLFNLIRIGALASERRQFASAARVLATAASLADALAVVPPRITPTPDAEDYATWMLRPVSDCAPDDEVVVNGTHLGDPVVKHSTSYGLSQRELEVLRLLAAGKSDRGIAATLFISPQTATTHVKHIRHKLGVRSRYAAISHAIRDGLV